MMSDKSKYGSFVPTTNIYSIENLKDIKLDSPEFRNFLVRLRNTVNQLAISSNAKVSGFYDTDEFVTGELFFKNPNLNSTTDRPPTLRPITFTVINFGSLPNTATKSVAHGLDISSNWSFINAYATATDTTGLTSIQFDYSDAATLSIDVDGTNVNITSIDDKTAYDTCYVFLKYIKN